MYYSIFIRDGYLQYHVSSVQSECEQGQSMSRRIRLSSIPADNVAAAVEQWHLDAAFHRCIPVIYNKGS